MKIEPIPKTDKYRLCEDEVLTYKGRNYLMKAGTISNGGSIPRIFWSISVTPYDPRAIRGFFWHDNFYATQEITKGLADEILKYIIIEDGIEEQVAENIYLSVRDFGGGAWARCKKELKNEGAVA